MILFCPNNHNGVSCNGTLKFISRFSTDLYTHHGVDNNKITEVFICYICNKKFVRTYTWKEGVLE